MLRTANQQLREQMISLQHLEPAKPLVEFLAAEKAHLLDGLTRATDDTTLRRLQGAVFVLSDLLELLKPRTP